VRANLAHSFDIPGLAKRLSVSPRTLARKLEASLGMSPIEFVQHLRIEVRSSCSRPHGCHWTKSAGAWATPIRTRSPA
jgi:hypothetical protein